MDGKTVEVKFEYAYGLKPVKSLKKFLQKHGRQMDKNLFVMPSGTMVLYRGEVGRIETSEDGINWLIYGVTIGPLYYNAGTVYMQTSRYLYLPLFKVI
jgi:hypothetical protein